ncbi:MAG: glycosyltransferase family 2 protein [Rikenellaceae bacterium]
MKEIAVVILNWNGRDFLEKFLPGVVRHSIEARVIVADNGSTDTSLEYIEKHFSSSEIEVISLERNYGFAEGYNRALDIVNTRYSDTIKYYLLLNSDVEVTEGWLTPILSLFKEEENTAAIQPKILSQILRERFEYAGASGGFIDSLGFPFCRGRIMSHSEQDNGQYDNIRPIFWATGAALAIRSEVWHRLGGLDPIFFAHMEEIDLCWRVKRLGYTIKVVPESVVYHVGGGTLPPSSPRKTYLNFRNNIAMLYKNLPLGKFIAVYFVRYFTDSLQSIAYLLTGKFSFFSAVIKGHCHFWRDRRRYTIDKTIPKHKVGEIYRGSIILRYIFCSKRFGGMKL